MWIRIDYFSFVRFALIPHFTPRENIMAGEKSEKKEYKNEDYAKRQQKQWEKKGYKVTRRKNVLYLKKG